VNPPASGSSGCDRIPIKCGVSLTLSSDPQLQAAPVSRMAHLDSSIAPRGSHWSAISSESPWVSAGANLFRVGQRQHESTSPSSPRIAARGRVCFWDDRKISSAPVAHRHRSRRERTLRTETYANDHRFDHGMKLVVQRGDFVRRGREAPSRIWRTRGHIADRRRTAIRAAFW